MLWAQTSNIRLCKNVLMLSAKFRLCNKLFCKTIFVVLPKGGCSWSSVSVGIGTTAPNAPLDVKGIMQVTAPSFAAAGTLRHTGSGGNFHIDTYGAGGIFLNWYSGSGVSVGNGSGGYGVINASGFNQTSDRRLKTDLTPLHHVLSQLQLLESYRFRYINDPTHRFNLGLIAQEVQKVFPEVVFEDKSGYLLVNYTSLVAPTISALTELKKEKDSEISELKAANHILKAESAQIKALLCEKFPDATVCAGIDFKSLPEGWHPPLPP